MLDLETIETIDIRSREKWGNNKQKNGIVIKIVTAVSVAIKNFVFRFSAAREWWLLSFCAGAWYYISKQARQLRHELFKIHHNTFFMTFIIQKYD